METKKTYSIPTTTTGGVAEYDWETILNYMDDDIREEVHAAMSPCTEEEFLADYIRRDPGFTIN